MADDRVENNLSPTRDPRSPDDVATLALDRRPLVKEVVTRPLQEQEKRATARFSEALCRTRTGDPFLTLATRTNRCTGDA